MINWEATDSKFNINKSTVRWRDKVIVSCEQCGYARPQTYSIAKKKSTHHCMSCIKRTNIGLKYIDIEATRRIGTDKITSGKKVIAMFVL